METVLFPLSFRAKRSKAKNIDPIFINDSYVSSGCRTVYLFLIIKICYYKLVQTVRENAQKP